MLAMAALYAAKPAERSEPLDTQWHKDILKGYEARYVDQGMAFDGPCRSTIIRRLDPKGSHKAYLYIHGFNDYFFQSEMGGRSLTAASISMPLICGVTAAVSNRGNIRSTYAT